GIGLVGKGEAHRFPCIVVAGNGNQGEREFGQQPLQMCVFFRFSAVDQVAGHHYDIGPRPQSVEIRDTVRECGGGVDLPVGELADRFDMQVGNLSNQDAGHEADGLGSVRRGSGCSASMAVITTSRAVAGSSPCSANRSLQSVTMASASCRIFSRLKRSTCRSPRLAPTTSMILMIANGQSRS